LKRPLPLLLLAVLTLGCSSGIPFLPAHLDPFESGGGNGRGGESGGGTVVKEVTDHIWLVWVVGPILLSLFFKEVRQPIAAALSAFFGLWAALWARLTGFVTKDPHD
jgi:hypothetical protein